MGGMQPNPAGLGTSADTSPASRFGVLREEGIRAGIDANRRLYSRRTRPFIPAGLSLYSRRAVLLFPQSCPFIPAGLAQQPRARVWVMEREVSRHLERCQDWCAQRLAPFMASSIQRIGLTIELSPPTSQGPPGAIF